MTICWRTDCTQHPRIDGVSLLNLPSACNRQANGSERAVSIVSMLAGDGLFGFYRSLPEVSGCGRGAFFAPSFVRWFFETFTGVRWSYLGLTPGSRFPSGSSFVAGNKGRGPCCEGT